MDQISVDRCRKLHPKLRAEAVAILCECNNLLTGKAKVRFTFTLRSFKEQALLYQQGRSLPGNIVTNAKAGSSYHNYGLAIDIALIIDGNLAVWDRNTDFDDDKKPDWMECVAVFQKYGWEWGGNWTSIKDYPHFQKTFGYHWSKLLQLHDAGKVDSEGFVVLP